MRAHPRLATILLKETRDALRALSPSRISRGDEHEHYWQEFEDIAVEHLLSVAHAWDGSLDDVPAPPMVLDGSTEE